MNTLNVKRGVLAIVFLLCIATGQAWGEIRYTLTDLGTIGNSAYSTALAINNRGEVVGVYGNQTVERG
jgi:hypothetical protein